MSEIIGGCLCGKVRYESSSEPLIVAACHCTNCRKQSGTAFSIIVGIASESLTISGDTLTAYDEVGSSGKSVQRYFCNTCGSPIYTRVSATEEILYIKAGSLDNSEWVEPTAEIWCDSKVSWSELNDSVAKFPASP